MKSVRSFLFPLLFVLALAANSPSQQSEGPIVSWGWNFGDLVSDTPTSINFVQVAGGSSNSLALKSDGSIVSWGNDLYGQVSNTPTTTGFRQVAGGWLSSVALKFDGSIVSWGRDASDQVSNTPTGTGNFAAHKESWASMAPYHTTVGDLNNDGLVDLVSQDDGGEWSLLLGPLDSAGPRIPLSGEADVTLAGVMDVDGDGDQEWLGKELAAPWGTVVMDLVGCSGGGESSG